MKETSLSDIAGTKINFNRMQGILSIALLLGNIEEYSECCMSHPAV